MSDTPRPENFRNGIYFNPKPHTLPGHSMGRWTLMRKFLFDKAPGAVPVDDIPVEPLTRAVLENARSDPETHVYRLGHSCVLMKFGAEYWLTDPVFCKRASPVQWFGPKRFHAPPIELNELPDLAGVILSHNHYDHFDRTSIRHLARSNTRFVTAQGNAQALVSCGVAQARITELNWWQSCEIGDLTLTATPTQHFSGRGLTDSNKSLWASFVLRHQDTRIFFGSDSGYFDGFQQIGARFGAFDLTMLECGAYADTWPNVHMKPEHTLQAHLDLGGRVLMPIHNSTFKLSFHPWQEPLQRLSTLAEAAELPLATPRFGVRVVVGNTPASDRWWQGLR